MTADAYHTWIGAIFIAMMIGFFIAGGKDILVSLLISGFVSVGVARMIRDGYEYVLGIRFPWGVIRIIVMVLVGVVVLFLVAQGARWTYDKITQGSCRAVSWIKREINRSLNVRRHMGTVPNIPKYNRSRSIYSAPSTKIRTRTKPAPIQHFKPTFEFKPEDRIPFHLRAEYSPDGRPRRLYHGTTRRDALDICNHNRIKVKIDHSFWIIDDFKYARDRAKTQSDGDDGLVVVVEVAPKLKLKKHSKGMYTAKVPEHMTGPYFRSKKLSFIGLLDLDGREFLPA